MFGNGKIFISHAHADNATCGFLLAALDAWGVDYWFDTQELSAGEQLSESLQRALGERDIFVRVCTLNAQASFRMDRELAAVRGPRANDRRGPHARRIIFLLLGPGYPQPGPQEADVVVNASVTNAAEWLRELRVALGVPEPGRAVSRRKLLAGGIAAGAAVVAASAAGMLLFAERTGAKAPPVRPTTHMPTPTPRPNDDRVRWYFTPVGGVADSLTVVAAPDIAVLSSTAGLYGLSPADGSVLWSTSDTSISGALLALQGAALYVVDTLGTLHAYDARSGSERWKAASGADLSSAAFGQHAPILAGGVLYVRTDQAVYAFSARDGSAVWTASPKNPARVATDPVIAGGVACFGADDGTLYAFDVATGQVRWSQPGAATLMTLGGADDRLIFAYEDLHGSYIQALNAADGTTRWKREADNDVSVGVPAAVVDGVAYLGAGNELMAMDAATGAVRWRTAMSQDAGALGFEYGPRLALSATTIYASIGNAAGGVTLVSFSRAAGAAGWRYAVPPSTTIPAAPVVAGDTVYFVGGDNALYALKA